MRTPGVLKQSQIQAGLKAAFKAGAKQAMVKVTLPDGTKMEITASAEGSPINPAIGDNEELSADDALANWQRTRQ